MRVIHPAIQQRPNFRIFFDEILLQLECDRAQEPKPSKVIGNSLHWLEFGCQVGWFVDPDDRSLRRFLPNQQPKLLQGNNRLPVPTGIALELTANQVFGWLKMAAE